MYKKKTTWIGLGLILITVMVAWLVAIKYLAVPDPSTQSSVDTFPASSKRSLKQSYVLQNRTGRTLKKAQFYVYAPVKQTIMQRVDDLRVSHPYRLINDDLNNQLLIFEFHDLPAGAGLDISIETDLSQTDEPAPAPLSEQEQQRFLRADTFIESQAPEIQKLAAELKADGAKATLENALDWLAGNVTQSEQKSQPHIDDPLSPAPPMATPVPDPALQAADATMNPLQRQGALHALKTKQGQIWDRVFLLTALSRANDIPARAVTGFVYRDGRPQVHMWLEFLHEGAWWTADVQNKTIEKNQPEYVAVRVLGNIPAIMLRTLQDLFYEAVSIDVVVNK